MRTTFPLLVLLALVPVLPVERLVAEEEPSAPPAAEEAETTIRILSLGEEPRQPLRYHPPVGTVQSLRVVMKMGMRMRVDDFPVPSDGMPGLEMLMDVHVDEVDEDGEIQARAVFRRFGLAPDAAVDAFTARRFEEAMGQLSGTVFRFTMTKRGLQRELSVEMPPGVDPQLAGLLSSTEEQFAELSYPVPEEAVGRGARWEVREIDPSEGWTMLQVTTYEVTELEGDHLAMSVTVTQSADEQPMLLEDLDPGSTARLEGHRGEGGGKIVQRLDEVVPRSATLELEAKTEMVLLEGLTRTGLVIDTEIEMSISSDPAAAQEEEAPVTPGTEREGGG